MRPGRWTLVGALALACLVPAPAAAQDIPRDEYLRFVPLTMPKLVRQTAPSAEFALYGDRASPGFVDEAPRNGVDDRRDALLLALARRFAPIMVRNTTMRPMDFRKFAELRPSFPLYVDEWQVATTPAALLGTTELDTKKLDGTPCADDARAPDCQLLDLLHRFGPPGIGDSVVPPARDPADRRFTVMFLDFPGEGEESWKEAYVDPNSGRLPVRYDGFDKVYVHPFIAEADSAGMYHVVLQYWFFYPMNDAGNKHEGDWEHVNVAITPRSAAQRGLRPDEVHALLARGPDALDGEDPLVIRGVVYYFHHYAMTLDFGMPNVYLPRRDWEAERKAHPPLRQGQQAYFEDIRRRAWWDAAETRVNTHPIVYIGADGKGPDLILYPPGGRNRDSHGSYPFPGLYKQVGPAGSAEEIGRVFDHRKADPDGTRGWPEWVERFDRPERLELVPDWEVVVDGVASDARMRRDWWWLVLPVRFGYPAARSPFAGVVEHAETGNLSILGPAFNGGWNLLRTGGGYAEYLPHRISRAVPGEPADQFDNKFGFLNAPLFLLLNLPPIDLVTKIGLAPVRAVTQKDRPAYFNRERPPERSVGVGVGITRHSIPDDFALTIINRKQTFPLLISWLLLDSSFVSGSETYEVDPSTTVTGLVEFRLGRHMSSENMLRYSSSQLRFTVLGETVGEIGTTAELQMWELVGALRYHLSAGAFRPYGKIGYGWSWWRTVNVRVEGEGGLVPDGDWIRQPKLFKLENLLPNNFQVGLGVDWRMFRSRAPFPSGVDVALRGEWAAFYQGIRLAQEVPGPAEGFQVDLRDVTSSVWRNTLSFMLVLGL